MVGVESPMVKVVGCPLQLSLSAGSGRGDAGKGEFWGINSHFVKLR